MTVTRLSVYSHCKQCIRAQLLSYGCKEVLNSSAERQLYDSGLQTGGALMLKALPDNESAVPCTDSNSLSEQDIEGYQF